MDTSQIQNPERKLSTPGHHRHPNHISRKLTSSPEDCSQTSPPSTCLLTWATDIQLVTSNWPDSTVIISPIPIQDEVDMQIVNSNCFVPNSHIKCHGDPREERLNLKRLGWGWRHFDWTLEYEKKFSREKCLGECGAGGNPRRGDSLDTGAEYLQIITFQNWKSCFGS